MYIHRFFSRGQEPPSSGTTCCYIHVAFQNSQWHNRSRLEGRHFSRMHLSSLYNATWSACTVTHVHMSIVHAFSHNTDMLQLIQCHVLQYCSHYRKFQGVRSGKSSCSPPPPTKSIPTSPHPSCSQTDRPVDGASLESLLDVHVLTLIVHHHDLKVVVLCLSIELHQRAMSYHMQRGVRIGSSIDSYSYTMSHT